jgi:hypothetical protein
MKRVNRRKDPATARDLSFCVSTLTWFLLQGDGAKNIDFDMTLTAAQEK